MATKNLFKNSDRVALKENPSCTGYIYNYFAPYEVNDPYYYQVQWDKILGQFLYSESQLIPEPKNSSGGSKT